MANGKMEFYSHLISFVLQLLKIPGKNTVCSVLETPVRGMVSWQMKYWDWWPGLAATCVLTTTE